MKNLLYALGIAGSTLIAGNSYSQPQKNFKSDSLISLKIKSVIDSLENLGKWDSLFNKMDVLSIEYDKLSKTRDSLYRNYIAKEEKEHKDRKGEVLSGFYVPNYLGEERMHEISQEYKKICEIYFPFFIDSEKRKMAELYNSLEKEFKEEKKK